MMGAPATGMDRPALRPGPSHQSKSRCQDMGSEDRTQHPGQAGLLRLCAGLASPPLSPSCPLVGRQPGIDFQNCLQDCDSMESNRGPQSGERGESSAERHQEFGTQGASEVLLCLTGVSLGTLSSQPLQTSSVSTQVKGGWSWIRI